jgi:hypothetical protein
MPHNLFYGLSGAKPEDYHSSRSFLLVYVCRKVSVFVSASTKIWDGLSEIINKIYDFLTRRWGFESGPDLSLPPCIKLWLRTPWGTLRDYTYHWLRAVFHKYPKEYSIHRRRSIFCCLIWRGLRTDFAASVAPLPCLHLWQTNSEGRLGPHCKDTIPKIRTNILRIGIAQPQSQFPYSCVCARFLYSHDQSTYSATGKYVDCFREYINRSQTHEHGNSDLVRVIPFLGIHKWDFCCSAEDNMWIILFYRGRKKQICVDIYLPNQVKLVYFWLIKSVIVN